MHNIDNGTLPLNKISCGEVLVLHVKFRIYECRVSVQYIFDGTSRVDFQFDVSQGCKKFQIESSVQGNLRNLYDYEIIIPEGLLKYFLSLSLHEVLLMAMLHIRFKTEERGTF